MAHFAKIEDDIVREVIVIDNEFAPTESDGQEFIASIGRDGEWIQCSYNTIEGIHVLGGEPFRGTYPGTGYRYDRALDKFIEP